MEGRPYTDLLVWEKSRQLASSVYQLTRAFPQEELFGLTSQMRRSAVSVASNIAEGCGRQYPKDALQFFFMARGSLYELETQLYISFDQGFLSQQLLSENLEKLTDCKKLLHGFINHYKQKLTV
ncbi:four helix bundle protein [Hymenobacter guriensis]|uniref:Four helix bundle protein n=1 Tax=Hymenobacter guriensis TaxID=2793065 RepID=A0ABS0L0R8_9BACT|nr:four helix bundle protein [Hymenobacter guriensis]MBG8553718.1 four helix bundle protein [Hymenobacter guriensis]